MEGGRWGLVIVAAAFLIQVFAFGLSSAIGVYNIEFLNYFDNDTMGVSLIASINWALFLGAGPLASFLMKKISYRKIALLGSTLVVAGVILMPFLPYIPAFCICFGVLSGIGSCLVYVPSHVLSGLYYKRHQSLATGIATSGSGLGGTIMPIAFGKLIEIYGWKGSLIIVAGLQLHLYVCAALLRSPPAGVLDQKKSTREETVLSNQIKCVHGTHSARNLPSDLPCKSEDQKESRAKLVTPEESDDLLMEDTHEVASKEARARKGESKELLKDTDEKEFMSSLIDLCQASDCNNGSLTTNCKFQQDGIKQKSVSVLDEETYICDAEKGEIKVLSHIYLFTHMGFNVYFFSSIMWNASAAMVLAFGPDFTTERGISQINSAWLLTIFGFGDFAGGILGGVIGNIWTQNHQKQYIFANLIFGLSLGFCPFANSFTGFAAVLLLAGLSFGVILGLLVVVLIDIIGSESLGDGLGYIMLANGIGAFMGPSLTGYIRQCTGSYDLAFYIGGLFGVIGGISMLFIPAFRHLFPASNDTKQRKSSTVEAIY